MDGLMYGWKGRQQFTFYAKHPLLTQGSQAED
jgi:hypothetical protein